MGQGAVVCGCNNSVNGVSSQQRQAREQATEVNAVAVKGQTTINQKAVAIAAKSLLVSAETATAVAVAAAMAPAAMAVTMRRWSMWAANVGGGIFCITYYSRVFFA
jgi:hypothetical protein